MDKVRRINNGITLGIIGGSLAFMLILGLLYAGWRQDEREEIGDDLMSF